jgi:hypothetical protein
MADPLETPVHLLLVVPWQVADDDQMMDHSISFQRK